MESVNEENIVFNYIDENGTNKEAEVLTLFNVNDYDKTYALCSIPVEGDNYNIAAFIVNQVNDENVEFISIKDPNELNNVNMVINTIINR